MAADDLGSHPVVLVHRLGAFVVQITPSSIRAPLQANERNVKSMSGNSAASRRTARGAVAFGER